ncbi:MAG: E3 binding domain-containing protein, partial [Planctomycetota bacterium]
SPKARRLASERGVNLADVRGSGTAGEILASDILAAAESKVGASSAAVDSGSPIYVAEEARASAGANERPTQLIVGIVHGQHFLNEKFKTIYQSGETKHRMGLCIVVHAAAIRETIELLPKNP